jgi:uncharacterized protein YggU (UPF0235/DUF167 family)
MLRLNVIAHPGARTDRVELLANGDVGVWVRARPVDGQANAAIERALAEILGLRPRQVKLIARTTGRRKIVEVDLPGVEALNGRLLTHGIRTD